MEIKFVSSGLVLLAVSVPFVQSVAQYYEPREYSPTESRYISVGFLDREFTPLSSNSLPDSLVIHYKRIMPILSFGQRNAEVFFGYATYTLLGSSKSTILFGGRLGTDVPIAGRRPSALLFSLGLAADYTRADGVGPSRTDFNIASVGVGGGLKYRYFSSGLDFSIGVEEFAEYSSEGIGVGSGFSATTLGEAILMLGGIRILDGIVVGYRFRLQTWSMNEHQFNYRSVSHGPHIGIMF